LNRQTAVRDCSAASKLPRCFLACRSQDDKRISHLGGSSRCAGSYFEELMKVLIRDSESQLYLAHRGRWSENVFEGRDFAFTAHAREVSARLKLKNFQILFYIPDLNYRSVVCDSSTDANMANA
jgi:hypothetical protein